MDLFSFTFTHRDPENENAYTVKKVNIGRITAAQDYLRSLK